ncbi:MAG TPA: PD-(D/E)XK nuclease family protein [Acidobacteriaceae bacterium]|nr:PD-(D/E)XK nuclease family protein [Acidobacteriaceae bacterium]
MPASAEKLDPEAALQSFVVGNRELTELEALSGRFNFFEALGAVRAERRHSCFLRFLLDPKANHGLGDRLLKLVLQTAVQNEPTVAPITPIDLDCYDLSQAELRLEYENIDILIFDEKNGLCVVIENKVDSTQHSDQLARYDRIAKQHFPHCTTMGVYLTASGEPSEHSNYASMTHGEIKRLVETVLANPNLHVEPDVRFAISQYTEVLGRHFMGDERITALCQRIYRQHKQAIDLIIENLPDARVSIRERLLGLLEAKSGELIVDDCTKGFVRFIPKKLQLPEFLCGKGWTSSKRLFLFEFQISQKNVILVVQMGPGDQEMRKRVHRFALAAKEPFRVEQRFYDQWQSLYKKPIVDSFDGDVDQILESVNAKWQEFLTEDLPRIEQAILAHSWSK